MKTITIEGRVVGEGHPAFIIAEAGLNHNGDIELANQLIDQAAQCGADAIKFQTYQTAELFPPDHPDYKKFVACEFSVEQYQGLIQRAKDQGVVFLSTPFDEASAGLLESLGVSAYKIGSGELNHLSFLSRIAQKNKPVILSTGMSSWGQIDAAVKILLDNGNGEIALLHCVSSYPCPEEKANVRMVSNLRKRFDAPIGYSDHTTTNTAAMAAVALGACVIEKHFTLSRGLEGWDHFFSYDPALFQQMAESIRAVERVLGEGEKGVADVEADIEAIARRSIYARRDIQKGEAITDGRVVVRRPVGPISADRLREVIGKKAAAFIAAESAIRFEDLES